MTTDIETDAHAPVPLLMPDMPSPQALLPWLERMHSARHYSNFGPLVRELETAFAQRFEVPVNGLTTVSNATLGLELAIQALGLARGARVLLPAFTFVATATAVLRAGLVPVLADVDEHSWLLTPEIARTVCAQCRVDAVMPVATLGMPHDMMAWQRFEEDTGLQVIVDAAAAYGRQWLKGAHGTLVFSLHTTKSLPAGEGGFVVSTRPGVAAKVRQLSNFGINLEADGELPLGALAAVGSNAKMSEYHAAVALAALGTWDEHALQRRSLYATLFAELNAALPGRLRWQCGGPDGAPQVPTLLCMRVGSLANRQALEQACAAAGIGTRRWYQPLLNDMAAIIAAGGIVLDAPVAQSLSQDLIGLPFFWGMTPSQCSRVVQVVAQALTK